MFSGRDSISSHFRHRNLNWAKLCSKLKWENMQRRASSVRNDTLEQKKNDLWGWRKAATDKRITPLLSTPGAVTPEQGTRLKRAGPWYFSSPLAWYMFHWSERGRSTTSQYPIQPFHTEHKNVFSPISDAASWCVTFLPSLPLTSPYRHQMELILGQIQKHKQDTQDLITFSLWWYLYISCQSCFSNLLSYFP